jgi:hypothetical protein
VKRWLGIAALVASHLAVAAVVAAVTAGYRTRAAFQRGAEEPLTRLGMRFEAPPEMRDSFPSLPEQVQAAGAKVGPATQQVLQLVGELRGNDMTGATRTCAALGWAYCEPIELNAMRKALVR